MTTSALLDDHLREAQRLHLVTLFLRVTLRWRLILLMEERPEGNNGGITVTKTQTLKAADQLPGKMRRTAPNTKRALFWALAKDGLLNERLDLSQAGDEIRRLHSRTSYLKATAFGTSKDLVLPLDRALGEGDDLQSSFCKRLGRIGLITRELGGLLAHLARTQVDLDHHLLGRYARQ